MPLPKIEHPTFSLIQPSTGKKLTFRPFTVKEEKILLVAAAENTSESTLNMIKQIIGNCIVQENFNVDRLPMFDIEYIFIKLRSKSVGNVIDFKMKDEQDGLEYELSVDLDKVEMTPQTKDHNKIMVTDSVGVIMRYPSIEIIEKINRKDELKDQPVETIFHIIASCIDKIFDGDGENLMVAGQDFTTDEAVTFLEEFPNAAFEKVQKFFDNVPSLEHVIKYKRKDGSDASITLKGLNDFFR
jgi:hypothetical protein